MNEETLSSFWRRRRSHDRPIALRDLQMELTYLARLILKDSTASIAWHEKLADNVIDNDGRIVGTALILDSTPINDIPIGQPIPDERVDALVGDTVYRANLEILNRDATYGAAARILDASNDPTIGREARVLSTLKHWKAYLKAQENPPAVRDYITTSREWKKEHIHEIATELAEACSQDTVSFQDCLDLFGLWLIYDIDLPTSLNPDVITAMLNAGKQANLTARQQYLSYNSLIKQIQSIAGNFSGFPNKADMPPPEVPQGDGDEEDGKEGTDEDAEQGSGQSSPDGTDKENEGEPPEGGPDDDSEESDDESDGEDEGEGNGKSDVSDDQEEESQGEDSSQDDDAVSDDEQESGSSSSGSTSDSQEGSTDRGTSGDSSDEEGNEGDEDEDDSSSGTDDDDSDDDGDDEDATGEAAAPKLDPIERVREGAKTQPMVDLIDQMDTLDDDTAEDIRDSIEFAREDITDEITSVGGGPGRQIIWEKAPYDAALESVLRKEAYVNATGITQILSRFKRLRTRVEHGQQQGYKLDRRRVGRIMYGNTHVWQDKTIIDRLDMCLVIMLDASGSIQEEQWELIRKTAASFVQALAYRDDVELMVVSYTTSSIYTRTATDYDYQSFTAIERIYDRRLGKIHGVRRYDGGTPSAIGFAAIRESIFKRLNVRKRDKIIIHLTDGAPDDNIACKEQVELNKKAGIETFCVLVEDGRQAEMMRNYYGANGLTYSPDDSQFKEIYGDGKFKHLEGYAGLLKCLTELFASITEAR